jgi:hypothetical protein
MLKEVKNLYFWHIAKLRCHGPHGPALDIIVFPVLLCFRVPHESWIPFNDVSSAFAILPSIFQRNDKYLCNST